MNKEILYKFHSPLRAPTESQNYELLLLVATQKFQKYAQSIIIIIIDIPNPYMLNYAKIIESPGNQEHDIEAVAKLVAAQATQQCPALWSSAPQFTSKNCPDDWF